MNFKQFVALLTVFTVVEMNTVATKTLAQKAKPSIRFGSAIASPGCVVADQLVGEDGRTLSILFENFKAENGERKPCNIRVNTTIPSGYRVKDTQIIYQGYTEVPSGTKPTTLSRSYIFNGGAFGMVKASPKISKFTSTNDLYQEQDEITAVSASCGGKGQFGINMVAQSHPGNFIIVDTADSKTGKVGIYFNLVPC